jgi:predicted transcriptional regulator
MTLQDILLSLRGELLTPGMNIDFECPKLFASDLMSDVLAFMEPGSVLITGLVNSHVVRTSFLVNVKAVIIVQGKRPDATVLNEARENKLPVISTSLSMFETCSTISRGLPGGHR